MTRVQKSAKSAQSKALGNVQGKNKKSIPKKIILNTIEFCLILSLKIKIEKLTKSRLCRNP